MIRATAAATAERPADVVADAAIIREERRRVVACLDSLTDTQRESIELAYYGGLTYVQVSERLSVNLADHQVADARRASRLAELFGCDMTGSVRIRIAGVGDAVRP